mgnify:CR=1 FL=1
MRCGRCRGTGWGERWMTPWASGADDFRERPGPTHVPRLWRGEHVADPLVGPIASLQQGESLEGEGGAGTIADEVFDALETPRHVAIRERDADTGVD